MDNLSHEELFSLYKWIVFWACDAIWDWMAWLSRALYRNEDKIEWVEHDHLKLIDSSLTKAIAIFLKTVWVVYIYKEKIWKKRIDSLLILKSWGVTVHKNSNWSVSYYQYFDWKHFYRFEKEDLIVLKSFSPLFQDAWMTPLKAVASQVATDLASVEFNRLFFENWGKPGTILKHSQKIDDNVRDKYVSKFKKDFMWLWNSHKLAFLDQWIELESLSTNQKEMEMTDSRKFTIDEVLMIFRVPKPILWKSDWVGFADRWVPGYYFTEYCLKPLALQIGEQLNKDEDLFVKEFFSYVFMQDKDELLKEYQSNTITLNEYRLATGKPTMKNWNVFWDWTEAEVEEDEKKTIEAPISKLEKSIAWVLESKANEDVFWTDEYDQKFWEKKIVRTDKYELELAKLQKRIWKAQEKDILENLSSKKDIKLIKNEDELFEEKKFNLMYIALYTKFFKDFMNKEWVFALKEISDETFAIAKLNVWIWENIDRMSQDIDATTRKEMFEIIKQGNRDKVWVAVISASIRTKFAQYTKKSWRIEKVVRTEITRASNKSQEEAYEQSWVVLYKQWFTALDERVCPFCNDMHWKKVKTWWDFLKLWTTHLWQKIEYETIKYPPRHVNCRCTIRPIIEE